MFLISHFLLNCIQQDRKDVEGNDVCGRGEIAIKGGNVTSGYYMMEDKTEEVFDSEGWFYTGDIGQFMADGSIRIVDRKKNLVKLKSGEYVALEKMEMVYGNSEFVDGKWPSRLPKTTWAFQKVLHGFVLQLLLVESVATPMAIWTVLLLCSN